MTHSRARLALLLALLALLLGGCRFAVVESGETVIVAPSEAPATSNTNLNQSPC